MSDIIKKSHPEQKILLLNRKINEKLISIPFYLQVGGVGQAAQAQVQEVLAGENDKTLGGTAKSQQVEEVGRVVGMMDPAIREAATPPVTPGAITLKMTGNLFGHYRNTDYTEAETMQGCN